jgi:hypothetical protein
MTTTTHPPLSPVESKTRRDKGGDDGSYAQASYRNRLRPIAR